MQTNYLNGGHQLFMVAHPQHPMGGLSYLVQRPYLDASGHPIQHRLIHPQQIQFPLQPPPPPQPQPPHRLEIQPALPLPPPPQLPPQPQSKDQTNAKIKSIKEKCITHYIDGQLIIETSKPLTEKKLKSSKKKKLQHQPHTQPQPQPQQQQQQIQLQPQLQSPHQVQHQSPLQIQHQTQLHIQHQPQPQHQLQLQHQHQPQQHQPQVQVQPIAQPMPQPIQQPQPQHPPQAQSSQNLRQEQPKPQSQQQQQKQIQTTPAKQAGNEIQQIRADMPKWSVAEVVDFIERHEDIRQYSSKFAEDEVDGKALLLMIDRNLNFQILTSMFKHGPAMKIEATLSKYKINEGH